MAKLDIPIEKLVKGKKPVSPAGMTITSWKDQIILKQRPKTTRKGLTPNRKAWVEHFKEMACWSKMPDPRAFNQASTMAKKTNWYYRDVIERAFANKLYMNEGETLVTTPTVMVYRTADETLVQNVAKALTPDNKYWDNNAFWNASVNPTRLTMRSGGLYLVMANVFSNVSVNAKKGIWLVVNGTDEIANLQDGGGVADIWRQNVFGFWYFHPGDYVECFAASSAASPACHLHQFGAVAITPEALL